MQMKIIPIIYTRHLPFLYKQKSLGNTSNKTSEKENVSEP